MGMTVSIKHAKLNALYFFSYDICKKYSFVILDQLMIHKDHLA